MAYLTYSEYVEFGYRLDEDAFNDLVKGAERIIDLATNNFYKVHDILVDKSKRRVETFKMAICEQVDFMYATGINKSYDLAQNEFTSITVGRLSLSPAGNVGATMKNGLCTEAYNLLGRYGLLYRGVHR